MLICGLLAPLGLVLGLMASSASASVTGGSPAPTPTPSVTPTPAPTCVSVTGHRGHRDAGCKPVQFDLSLVNDYLDGASFNDVTVQGPRHLTLLGGRDTENSAGDASVFADSAGDSIDVSHSASLGTGAVDRAVCEVRFTAADLPWTFTGGTGSYLNATGLGVYSLTADFSFGQDRRGRCTISRLSDAQVIALITQGTSPDNGVSASWCRRHHVPVPVLLDSNIFVQGRGVARVPHVRPVWAPTPAVTA